MICKLVISLFLVFNEVAEGGFIPRSMHELEPKETLYKKLAESFCVDKNMMNFNGDYLQLCVNGYIITLIDRKINVPGWCSSGWYSKCEQNGSFYFVCKDGQRKVYEITSQGLIRLNNIYAFNPEYLSYVKWY
nr:uncharacterized protein LOC100207080 [Hydra vulgaris]